MKRALTYLGLLVRLFCSLILLLLVAHYAQLGDWGIPANQYVENMQDIPAASAVTAAFFSSWNWVSVTAIALVVLTLLRVMNLVWNVAFHLSIVAFLILFCCSTDFDFLQPIAALMADVGIAHLAEDACVAYSVPVVLTVVVFLLGWLAATPAFRIALTSVICFVLWLGLTALSSYAVVLWAGHAGTPTPDALSALLTYPWIPAAVIGAFFLIYSTLIAIVETFPCACCKKIEEPAAEESTPTEKLPAAPETPAEETPKAEAAPAEPAPEAPKAEEKPAAPAPEAPKAEEKPAEPAPEAPKAEEKPAEPAPEAPKAEEKPAEPAPEAPKPEETPAEPAPEAPKPEETPAEPAPEAPKAEEQSVSSEQ